MKRDKGETKDDKMIVRVNPEQRKKILDGALERDMTISSFVREATDFYSAFPRGFLEQIEKIASQARLPVPTVIVHLLQKYLSLDNALIKQFGGQASKTWVRAFRFTPEGKLIEGEELSDLLGKEDDEQVKELRRKLEQSKKTGKPATVAGEEIRMIAELM